MKLWYFTQWCSLCIWHKIQSWFQNIYICIRHAGAGVFINLYLKNFHLKFSIYIITNSQFSPFTTEAFVEFILLQMNYRHAQLCVLQFIWNVLTKIFVSKNHWKKWYFEEKKWVNQLVGTYCGILELSVLLAKVIITIRIEGLRSFISKQLRQKSQLLFNSINQNKF